MPLSRSLLYGSAPYHLSLLGRAPAALALRLDQPWPGDAARGAALLAGNFSFAGETAQSAMPPWTAPMSPQWLADLHGFSWLADLAAIGDAKATQAARHWAADWLTRCDAWDAVAWRADVIGDRLFAWIEHMDLLAGGADDGVARRRLRRQPRAPGAPSRARRRQRSRRREARLAGAARPRRGGGGARRRAAARPRARRVSSARSPRRSCPMAAMSRAARRRSWRRCAISSTRAPRCARAQVAVPAALQSAIDRTAPMLRFFRHGDGTLGAVQRRR